MGAIIIGVIVFVFIVIGIFLFQKRESLLDEAIAKAKNEAYSEYGIDLKIEKATFSGFRSVALEGVQVIPKNGVQLAGIKHLEVSVKLMPLLSGVIKIGNINLSDASLTLIKKDSTSNYDFIFKEEKEISDSFKKTEPVDLGKLANRMINSVLYKIPDNMILKGLEMSYRDDSLYQTLSVPQAAIDDGKLTSIIHVNKNEATWHLEDM